MFQHKHIEFDAAWYWFRFGVELIIQRHSPKYDHWGWSIVLTVGFFCIELTLYDDRHREDLWIKTGSR